MARIARASGSALRRSQSSVRMRSPADANHSASRTAIGGPEKRLRSIFEASFESIPGSIARRCASSAASQACLSAGSAFSKATSRVRRRGRSRAAERTPSAGSRRSIFSRPSSSTSRSAAVLSLCEIIRAASVWRVTGEPGGQVRNRLEGREARSRVTTSLQCRSPAFTSRDSSASTHNLNAEPTAIGSSARRSRRTCGGPSPRFAAASDTSPGSAPISAATEAAVSPGESTPPNSRVVTRWGGARSTARVSLTVALAKAIRTVPECSFVASSEARLFAGP
jgi:hypothetical protein